MNEWGFTQSETFLASSPPGAEWLPLVALVAVAVALVIWNQSQGGEHDD